MFPVGRHLHKGRTDTEKKRSERSMIVEFEIRNSKFEISS
jgi:hypothetical protein